MFDRALLKSNAKQALKRFYGMALVATLIFSVITGIGSNFTVKNQVDTEELSTTISEALADPQNADPQALAEALGQTTAEAAPATLTLGLTALGILFALFVAYQLEVGYNRFYLNARENTANIGDLFWSYKNNLGTTMGTLLCRDIFIALWSLLLVFPGIIKAYQYSMVPYLLAENPKMTRKRAFQISKAMTKGHKWDLFVLDLSFIGWTLLGLLCCCIGVFFLRPYIQATKAEAYTFLKARVIENGEATPDEFEGFAALNA